MKPATAAKKLEVLLTATPEAFRDHDITRDELAALQADPPEWLVTLRREGPHPRPVVAQRLGVSNSGLARGGVDEPLTTAQIGALLDAMPEWLTIERERQRAVRAEETRIRRERAGQQ
ncbi:DUF5997 family protein [Lysinimonas soli]|uniref:DUF5997 family protein n=1 Tax=Lysinimonas soli TaxID=1074233 RepID=A0ABW0NNQ8_9MICO